MKTECSLWKYLYLAYFSKPAGDRQLYRGLKKVCCRSIVEIGIRPGTRTNRLLQVAARFAAGQPLRYTGIDAFELRPSDTPQLPLKQAHRMLANSGAKVQLVPGDPHTALSRAANTLLGTDLILVSADQVGESLDRAWYFVPRMLHGNSRILLEQVTGAPAQVSWKELDPAAVQALVASQARQRRRAA